MEYEFEGRTEKEAIDRAAAELGLQKDDFDVEILESQRAGLFKKGYVKIRVHTAEPTGETGGGRKADAAPVSKDQERPLPPSEFSSAVFGNPEAKDAFEQSVLDYTTGLIERMGYACTVSVLFRENKRLGINIDSGYSAIIIGKKGKNLDALQLLANIFAIRTGHGNMRIVLDTENYRARREETLVRLAYTVADRVRESRHSVLLEPMSPFDRRLVHNAINGIADIETKSEGEGSHRQVRVFPKGHK
jgi:spoIIIJ-associated protein